MTDFQSSRFSHSISRHFPQTRPRRSRRTQIIRDLVAESTLLPADLIYPVFLIDGEGSKQEAIETLPGIARHTIDSLLQVAERAHKLGISGLAFFPRIDNAFKTEDGRHAYDDDNLVARAIKAVKSRFPDLLIIADIALDPYTSHGQDGLLDASGNILNDETTDVLVKQANMVASVGADVVAPSDMMDGRIGAIRKSLETNHFTNTIILSYAAKYASHFYGPFRDAVGSSQNLGKADKKTYQMDPRNTEEALHEVALDLQEGADWVMVKPGMPYLDIVTKVRETFQVPTFAYQVSGEYAMLQFAAKHQALDLEHVALESLMAFKRAGAHGILSYFALDAAKWLQGSE